ncbi:uncharacterized protein LOC119911929 [Micropterus salmoides]|uniref:uncharacterized protein LOC119911929 n=1 Tax=Micropterus salmoides TaxID=27706 RepID=UPI0018EB8E32|nr:uncharacterized protein LOC119911929 [Micropterus salmoides]
MRGPYNISYIEVIPRSDCCIYDQQGAEILIGNSLENNGNNNPRCGVITVINEIKYVFNCDQMEGRYVNVFIRGVGRRLQLCEVKVYATTTLTGTNVAPRGVATQSGRPASAATAPQMAIDEDSGKDPQSTCASVPLQDNPWWQLDLRSIYKITAVSVTSISDCCSEELDGAEIRIGLKNDTSNQRCAIISIATGQSKYNYQCGIMEGRFVHVVLPGLQKNLTLCEVQVYVLDSKKRSVLKIRTDFDMSDPVIQQQILKQLETNMKSKRISDFKISWRTSGRVSRKTKDNIYHLINGSLIWYEAQSFCRVECTNLATVNNMDCNNMLVNTLGSHVTYSWIGLWAGGTHRQCMVRTDVSHGCVE